MSVARFSECVATSSPNTHLLVAFDRRPAARWAGAVADRLGAPLNIVSAAPYRGHHPSGGAAAIRDTVIAEQREYSEMILKTAQEEIRSDYPALVVTTA
jgi:hypothetical protein